MAESISYGLCPDAILQRSGDGTWVFSNPRVHRHVELGPCAVDVLMRLGGGALIPEWEQAFSGAEIRPRTAFTNARGLLADPSGLAPTGAKPVVGVRAVEALRKAWILCRWDGRDYEEFLSLQTSVLDAQHLGTFHQNVGRHLLLDLRLTKTWRWWHDQKFEPDGLRVRPGPYEWVQRHFFDSYFGHLDFTGQKLLDFACGNGFYSRRFAERGAEVVGIDTSPELISIAKRNHGGKVRFLQPADVHASNRILDDFPAATFDRVYVSDALLFFFHAPKTGLAVDEPALELLRRLRRLLRPSGILYLMEPNGTFWLTSHAGQAPRPIAMVTEYRQRVYHVAPTHDHVISTLGRSGFVVADLIHPAPDPSAQGDDPQMLAFANAFPLWDFYVCPVRAESA